MRAQELLSIVAPRGQAPRGLVRLGGLVCVVEAIHGGEPLLLRALVDEASSLSRLAILIACAVGICALYFARAIVLSISVRVAQRCAALVGVRVRRRLYAALQGRPGGLACGDALHRLTADAHAIERGIAETFPRALGIAAGTLSTVGGMLLVSPRATLVALVLSVPVAFGGARARRAVDEASVRSERAQARVLSHYEERLRGEETLLAFGRQRHEALVATRTCVEAARREGARVGAAATLGLRFELLLAAAITVVLLPGVLGVRAGVTTLGSLLALYAYVAQLLMMISATGALRADLSAATASAQRIQEVSAALPQRPRSTSSAGLPEGPLSARLEGVRVAYDAEREALRGVDLVIAPGEHVVLVGPSGAGKSTLARTLAGLMKVATGSARVGDVVACEMSPSDRARAIAFAPQAAALFDATLEENVTLGRRALALTAEEAARRAGLAPRLLRDLATAGAGPQGTALSGGERQAVALARVLVSDARFIVLDEPTSAMDAVAAAAAWDAIFAFARGRTLVVVVHDAAVVARFRRRVTVVAGVIAEDDRDATPLAPMVSSRPVSTPLNPSLSA